MHKLVKLGFLSLSACLVLSACGTVDSQAGFTSAPPRPNDNLAAPPGLTSPDLTTNYKMNPVAKSSAQGYQATNIAGMHIETGGSQRWLVLESQTVDKVYPMLLAYLDQVGLSVKYQNPAIGVIQSDWLPRNTKVPQGASIRGLFDWIGWGSMYSLNSMYMYRVTVWPDGNRVVIMATNYQMDEEYEGCGSRGIAETSSYASSDSQRTKWIARPSNPQLELEFLTQFMAFSGVPTEQVKQVAATVTAAPKDANMVNNQIVVNDQFDRAWWRTGLALDRIGLGVVDKNRSTGEYYVYPLAAQIDNPDPGIFSKWFGSNESGAQTPPKPLYTVKLTAGGLTASEPTAGSKQTIINLNLYDSSSQDKNFAKNQKTYLTSLAGQLQ